MIPRTTKPFRNVISPGSKFNLDDLLVLILKILAISLLATMVAWAVFGG